MPPDFSRSALYRFLVAALFVIGLLFAFRAHAATYVPAPKDSALILAGSADPRLTDCALAAERNLRWHPGTHLAVIIAPIQHVPSYAVTDGVRVWHDNEVYRIEDVCVIEEWTPQGWVIEPPVDRRSRR